LRPPQLRFSLGKTWSGCCGSPQLMSAINKRQV
jgi:hypothetical protein